MSVDARTITIDDWRLSKIEEIGLETKTRFTKWEEFVNETIGMYLNWWTNPIRASSQFIEMIPHMTNEMRKNIKAMMHDDEFDEITVNLQEKIDKLTDLPYYVDAPGDKRFEIDSTRFDGIQDIIKQDKTKAKFPSVQIFCNYALDYFIELWKKPKKAREKIFEVWPYMSTSIKNQWKIKYPKSFTDFNKLAADWNKETDAGIKHDNDEEVKNEVGYDKDGFDSVGYDDEIINDYESNIKKPNENSENSYQAYIRFCEQRNKQTIEKIKKMDIPNEPSEISLPHDHHPLISSFYSRFFPIKIAVAVLAQLMVERNERTVKYDDFRKEAYDVAVYISNKIREYEERHGKKRNQKKSAGLPYPITGSDATKIASSKERFREHFVGMKEESWAKRQEKSDENKKDKGIAHFDGALNAMGLAYVEVTKNKQPPRWNKDLNEFTFEKEGKYDFRIGLTEKGLKLYLYENEIFDKNSKGYQDKMFSDKETDFIFDNIIGEIELENELVKKILETIRKNTKTSFDKKTRTKKPKESKGKDGAYLDEEIETIIISWIQKHKEDKERYKNIFNIRDVDKAKSSKALETIRSAIMGRLVEINKINWEIEEKTSNTLYSLREK